ncbi:hypothetical protein QDR37_02125 [Amnibacterium sp. CER49]|uniref:hypothetical protein n=1 Tax=Amnibacterium sp. CER49 TaxID=3039161 RepID=UPI00244D02AD|nr:hypothetical protein [Amnibacterium sp. CER49]MDH2442734.1 hypothetical protein [Amnibacterium sp. CER49]
MRKILTVVLATTAALGLSVATAGAANASTGSSTLHVTVSSTGTISTAHTVHAGLVRFDLEGAAGQSVQLAKPKHGASVQTLLADGMALNTKGDASRVERDFAGLGGASVFSGSDFWQVLHAGTYYLVDTAAQSLKASDVAVLKVTGSTDARAVPESPNEIRAVKDMVWASNPASIRHEGLLRFDNDATDYHFAELAQLKPGVTRAQVLKVLQTNGDPSTILAPHGADYSTGVLSPGTSQLSTYDLPRGHYALLCFWPDEHGVPHALMGMVRTIELR